MIIDGMDFDDDLSAVQGRENLWRAVLMNAIEEAVFGVSRSHYSNPQHRAALIKEAREYVTRPNRDFDTVCYLAGLDPEAVRERVAKQIAAAAAPGELVTAIRQARRRRNDAKRPGPKARNEVCRYEHDGMNLTISEWSRRTGVPPMTIRQRLAAGWHISRAIEKVDGRTTRHRIAGRRSKHRPGVVSNLPASKGTGAGSTAQETSNISFSESNACPQ